MVEVQAADMDSVATTVIALLRDGRTVTEATLRQILKPTKVRLDAINVARTLENENPPWLNRVQISDANSHWWCVRFGSYKMLLYFQGDSVPDVLK